MHRSLVVVALAVVGCSAVSPPPLLPMHASTAPNERGDRTVTLVAGFAGELFGGEGWGIALRGEQQVLDSAAVGVQLGGGRGEEGESNKGKPMTHWLLELRTYGRVASPSHDWAAGMAGVGVSAMDTGLRAVTIALGGAVSYPNQYIMPALGAFAAVSVPLRTGRGFGVDNQKIPHTTWWFGTSAAVIVPFGETRNAASIEAGVAFGDGGDDSSQMSFSFADRQTF